MLLGLPRDHRLRLHRGRRLHHQDLIIVVFVFIAFVVFIIKLIIVTVVFKVEVVVIILVFFILVISFLHFKISATVRENHRQCQELTAIGVRLRQKQR